MTAQLPTYTKLSAVNICLNVMGERPVNSLEDAAVDAQMAINTIEEISTFLQSSGWYWNREVHTLSPDNTGQLVLPVNTARVDAIEGYEQSNVVQRGSRLFDVENNTYIFAKPLKVELHVVLPFDDLSLPVRRYVTIKAARTLQARVLGSVATDGLTASDEQAAWVNVLDEEAQVADRNMLTDSWSVAGIISQYRRGY